MGGKDLRRALTTQLLRPPLDVEAFQVATAPRKRGQVAAQALTIVAATARARIVEAALVRIVRLVIRQGLVAVAEDAFPQAGALALRPTATFRMLLAHVLARQHRHLRV